MHNENNPTILTCHNQITFKLNSGGFSTVKNLPFLQYWRSVHLMTDREMVAKWSTWGGEGEIRKSENERFKGI
jgi:hypothetical protein